MNSFLTEKELQHFSQCLDDINLLAKKAIRGLYYKMNTTNKTKNSFLTEKEIK